MAGVDQACRRRRAHPARQKSMTSEWSTGRSDGRPLGWTRIRFLLRATITRREIDRSVSYLCWRRRARPPTLHPEWCRRSATEPGPTATAAVRGRTCSGNRFRRRRGSFVGGRHVTRDRSPFSFRALTPASISRFNVSIAPCDGARAGSV